MRANDVSDTFGQKIDRGYEPVLRDIPYWHGVLVQAFEISELVEVEGFT